MNTAIINSKISRSEQFLDLSNDAALLFILALPHCDDYGRIKASPKHWALTVCPGRFTIHQLPALLSEILAVEDQKGERLMVPYEVGGEQFYYMQNWFRFQGFRSNYTARAMFPHPVLGIVEPGILGGPSKAHFGDRWERYNELGDEVRLWLQSLRRGKSGSLESGLFSPDNADNPSENGSNPSDPTENGQNSRENTPPYTRAAPATASATASPNQSEQNREAETNGGSGGNPPPPDGFQPPSVGEVAAYLREIGVAADLVQDEASKFCDHYAARGWQVKGDPMVDWRASARQWKRKIGKFPGEGKSSRQGATGGAASNGKPKEGLDYYLGDVGGTIKRLAIVDGIRSGEPFDEQAWLLSHGGRNP
jgi:hypothetical protein